MEKKLLMRRKYALMNAYCTMYYSSWPLKREKGDYTIYLDSNEKRFYSAKTDVYFPCGMDDEIVKQIKDAAKGNMVKTQSYLKINIGIPVNCFYKVSELPDDFDLLENPQNYYMIEGGDICPRFETKKRVISIGLEGIPCFVLKRDFEDVSHLSEQEHKNYIASVEKIEPKFVRVRFIFPIAGVNFSKWIEHRIFKKYIEEGVFNPLVFYEQEVIYKKRYSQI